MSTHVYVCQYQDKDLHWHDAIRITTYSIEGNDTKDTVIDLENHKEVDLMNNIESAEHEGCFIYKH